MDKLPLVVDTKALPVQLGKQPAGSTFVSFVAAVNSQLTTLLPSLTIDHFEISDSTYELTLISKQGMQVQFNTLGDAGVQSRNLVRLVQQHDVNLTSSKVNLQVDRWAYVN